MGSMKRVLILTALAGAAWAADFQVADEAGFRKLFPANAKVERVATGLKFLEGPVWMRGGFLVFSDIPANQLKRWDAKNGVSTFREPSGNSNGNTLDGQGCMITAEHGGRRVSRTGTDGKVVTLVDSFEGKKLNSPNDVVVKADGTIWFTDPDYGLAGRAKELPGNFVYRFDPKTGKVAAVVKDFDKPNGLCFSPDERRLYIADSGKPRHIRVFDAGAGGALTDRGVFVKIDKGGPDGIRCDAAGRIWSSSGDGAQVFSPEGKLLARILLPESGANLGFGGKDGRTLFVTARTSLYSVPTLTRDAKRGKRR
jgi:gluconolactonase